MDRDRKRGRRLVTLQSTRNLKEFKSLCKKYFSRKNIVAEGDSWFSYPPKGIVTGSPSNVISFLKKKKRYNLLEMARNGDEVTDMLSGQSKFQIIKVIKECRVDFLLFSGGGNDLVGKYDFEYLLKNEGGRSAKDYIRRDRFERKIAQIRNAYSDLVDYCLEFSQNKDIKIITHCYGYAIPQSKSAKFIWGLIDFGPWMYPALHDKNIPQEYWRDITKILIDSLKKTFIDLSQKRKGIFYFVDSTQVIEDRDWIDEIHLKPKGFSKVADLIYDKIEELS